ncbi:MAG TPA: uracil-DNA glycosylase family protein [Chitinophagaceae bacterium]
MDNIRIEKHPFTAFIPSKVNCLILGSFPGREQTLAPPSPHEWFYGAKRNQLWQILEWVYERKLEDRTSKQALFESAGIAITDIIKTCRRRDGTNMDENLEVIEWNTDEIDRILKTYSPPVFFTSRFVEKQFKRFFPDYKATDLLPSPSPRYFRLRITDKARIYKQKLPSL